MARWERSSERVRGRNCSEEDRKGPRGNISSEGNPGCSFNRASAPATVSFLGRARAVTRRGLLWGMEGGAEGQLQQKIGVRRCATRRFGSRARKGPLAALAQCGKSTRSPSVFFRHGSKLPMGNCGMGCDSSFVFTRLMPLFDKSIRKEGLE